MGNLFTEREALRQYISWVQDERRKLADEYWKAIQRLKELDAKEYEELNRAPQVLDNLYDVTQTISNVVNQMPLDTLISALMQNSKQITIEEEETQEGPSQRLKKEMQKADSYRRVKRRRVEIKTIAPEIISLIKQSGGELDTKSIQSYIESKGLKVSNISNIMSKVMAYDDRIERERYGIYRVR